MTSSFYVGSCLQRFWRGRSTLSLMVKFMEPSGTKVPLAVCMQMEKPLLSKKWLTSIVQINLFLWCEVGILIIIIIIIIVIVINIMTSTNAKFFLSCFYYFVWQMLHLKLWLGQWMGPNLAAYCYLDFMFASCVCCIMYLFSFSFESRLIHRQ